MTVESSPVADGLDFAKVSFRLVPDATLPEYFEVDSDEEKMAVKVVLPEIGWLMAVLLPLVGAVVTTVVELTV